MFKRFYVLDTADDNAVKKTVLNIDLMKLIAAAIGKHVARCFISKVKAHAGIVGNEKADDLANRGREF